MDVPAFFFAHIRIVSFAATSSGADMSCNTDVGIVVGVVTGTAGWFFATGIAAAVSDPLGHVIPPTLYLVYHNLTKKE